ncbi:MAG: sugar phosphate isomerase/epimerase [Clostridia bacterium]|nr:sugar phosphate isomerase/epimerase [Clostridia bacterium]
MFEKLGLQLYTVRDLLLDPDYADLTFRRLRELGYTEVQLAGNYVEPKLLGELLKKNDIRIVGTHYPLAKILENPEETIATHRMWGTTNIGIGAIPREARESLEALRKFIKDYNEAAKLYAKEDFKLTYHNHNFEFERIDGYKTLMDIFYEEFDPENITFVLDTCWVAAGGGDVCAWMRKLQGRLDILHLKDYTVKTASSLRPDILLCEVGNGNLDWDSIMACAEEIGVKHYCVEQDMNFDGSPLNSLGMSAKFLQKYQK